MGDYAEDIKKLYTKVMEKHKNTFNVDTRSIRKGIRNLAIAYMPNPEWKSQNQSAIVDFNNPGDRCAYLFKYAMLHTGLVCDVLERALKRHRVRENIARKRHLNLCSLGSGPGSDILALLLVFKENNLFKDCYASLIDCSAQWKYVFCEVVSELNQITRDTMMSRMYFDYQYLACDLLQFDDDKVYEAIENADIITMVKFLSAAACKDSGSMVKKICSAMKLGALLLFVDNAAGGFHEIMKSVTESCGMVSVFGPIKHYDYEEQKFVIASYDNNSQYKTKVSFEIWEKVYTVPQNTTRQLQQEFFRHNYPSNENITWQARSYNYPSTWQARSSVDNRVTAQRQKFSSSKAESFHLRPEYGSKSEDNACCIIM